MGEKPIKVLLIEDSVFATRYTQKMLAEANSSQFNAELECADQLSVGLKRLAEDHIDIVLLDLTLPDSHDLDTFTSVHAQAPEMPIVVLTGLEDEKLAVEAVGKGAQDYLVKGQLDSNLLKRSILYAIERKEVHEELRKSREHLGELVEERTAELKKTNEQLRKDITERKKAEKALQESEEKFKLIYETSSDAIMILKPPTWKFTSGNSAIVKMFGVKNEKEFISLRPWDVSPKYQPDGQLSAAKAKKMIETTMKKGKNYFEWTHQTIQGKDFFATVLLNKIEMGDKAFLQARVTDITERKKAEKALQRAYRDLERAHHQLRESQAQLIQTEKMSALGTLVAGTAHELNNPIMGIMNFSAHCIKHTSEQDELYTVLQDIEHEAKHSAEIVRNLLTFSHTEKDDDKAYEKESLAEILGRVLKLLSYRIEKQRILVTQHIADDTPEIWIKPNSIQQLILNLATNAFDALEGSEKKELNVDIHREGEFVRMTIADTGCGIAAESLTSIFDPFFTTKPVGQGTGLGLSVSQGIVKAQGGQISCESEPGAGTKFTILLPIERSKQNEQANTCN